LDKSNTSVGTTLSSASEHEQTRAYADWHSAKWTSHCRSLRSEVVPKICGTHWAILALVLAIHT